MISGLVTLTPAFVGPLAFLLGTLLVIVLLLLIGRLVFGFAWNVIVIVAVALIVLWLVGAVRSGPPALG